MGTTFTALLLRKFRTNYQYTLHHLGKCLEEEGYRPVQEPGEAELAFSQYLFGDQGWQAVTGDMTALVLLGEKLAKKNKAEALLVSCCDSDFVEFELFCPSAGTRTRARAGVSYDGSNPPRVEQEQWKQAARLGKQDTDFAEIFGRKRVFAEESLSDLGDALGFDGGALIEAACGAGGDPDRVLYLSRKDLPPKRITEGMPLLERRAYFDKPVPVDEPYQWSFINRGGPSMGIELMIYGPFVEADRMTFTDVHLRTRCNPETEEKEWWRFDPEPPIQKIRLTNGWYAYRYRFPDLPLQPGINFDYMRLRPDYELLSLLEVDVLVTGKGDARCGLDVYFSLVPMDCPDRSRGFAWTVCGVGEHESWIAQHNAWYETQGGQKEFMLDPGDFEY